MRIPFDAFQGDRRHGLSQAGKNFAVDFAARLLDSGDDDLPECLELDSGKPSDFQIFEVGGKNSGDSWCDSFLRHDEKKKAFWSKIRTACA